MTFLRSLVAALLVAFVLVSAAAPPARVGGAPSAPPRTVPPQRPAAGAMPPPSGALQAPLPDTTLVRIFFAKGRADVTLSQLRVGAYRLGAWPDSLTPEETRQVLGLLVQQAILKHRVQQDRRRWTMDDSTEYRLFEDRITLMSALDSALVAQAYRMAARGDTVPDREGLGIIVRDSALAALQPVYDEDAFKTLAAGFAALPKPTMEQPIALRLETAAALPVISAADSAKVLLACNLGTYSAGQLLIDLGRMNPQRRPIIGGVEDLRDLCKSKIYETMLRQAVVAQGIARKPRLRSALKDHAEMLDMQRFVTRQVYEKVPVDSAALRRHFRSAPGRFMTPAQAVVVRTVLDQRADADTLVRKLTVPGFAESLIAQSSRAGIPYRAVVDERSDSTLFRRAERGGVGAVIGPDQTRDGWRVIKVMDVQDRRAQTFGEAYPYVMEDWRNVEGGRLMREMMTQLMGSSIVNVNVNSPYLTGRKRIPR